MTRKTGDSIPPRKSVKAGFTSFSFAGPEDIIYTELLVFTRTDANMDAISTDRFLFDFVDSVVGHYLSFRKVMYSPTVAMTPNIASRCSGRLIAMKVAPASMAVKAAFFLQLIV